MDLVPGDIFIGQGSQHEPRRFATADGEYKSSAVRHRLASCGGDDGRGAASDGIGIAEYFDFHVGEPNDRLGDGSLKNSLNGPIEHGIELGIGLLGGQAIEERA